MNPQPLDLILDALAHSTSMVPDADDRAAVRRTAEVCRGLKIPPQVVLVHPRTDPVVDTIEWLERLGSELRDTLGTVEDHVDDLLRVMRQRRNSPLAEIVRSILARSDESAVGTMWLAPADITALRKALAAWDGAVPNPASPSHDGRAE